MVTVCGENKKETRASCLTGRFKFLPAAHTVYTFCWVLLLRCVIVSLLGSSVTLCFRLSVAFYCFGVF